MMCLISEIVMMFTEIKLLFPDKIMIKIVLLYSVREKLPSCYLCTILGWSKQL